MFENQQLSDVDDVFAIRGCLALHAARAGTLHQALDLRDGDAVVVAQNRVLQAGCRHSKLQRGLFVRVGVQTVNQAAAEGVAAANAVDDVQVVLLGEAVLIGSNIVQHSAPAVVEGAVALTQGDSDLLEVELAKR